LIYSENLNDFAQLFRFYAIIKTGKELKCNNLSLITEDTETEEKTEWFGDKAIIKFIPLWKLAFILI